MTAKEEEDGEGEQGQHKEDSPAPPQQLAFACAEGSLTGGGLAGGEQGLPVLGPKTRSETASGGPHRSITTLSLSLSSQYHAPNHTAEGKEREACTI